MVPDSSMERTNARYKRAHRQCAGRVLKMPSREIKYKDPNCYNEAVIAYRDRFELMPNRGFRQDIAVTVKTYEDLMTWQKLLANWGYTDRQTGKWIRKNPLNVKGMLDEFDRIKLNREAETEKRQMGQQAVVDFPAHRHGGRGAYRA